jgi:aerobic-type carbon monoxide dehydrogenase small subunit (CoxS/CutS family)
VEGTFRINGKVRCIIFHSAATLLDVLRKNGHTEVKRGCGMGECGACIVLLDGKIVNSCQVFAASAMGSEILTTKGLGSIHSPHPIHRAFVDTGAVQCGFCTPSMVIVTYYLLQNTPRPSEKEIKRAFDGSLCRCTGYVKIIEAVKLASERIAHER